MPKFYISKEELIELYINQKLSLNTISKMHNCHTNTVKNRLKEYNVPIRSKGESLKNNFERELGFSLTAEKIMEKINEGMFIYEVAEFFGVNRKSITKRLKKAGIDLSQLESHQKLMAENNSRTSREMWMDKESPHYKNHMERLKEINKKRTEKAQLRYETAHLKSYEEYKKACARIVDHHYGKVRPDGMEYDHKYSIRDGYINGVPAPILSHPFNLRLITAWENNSKGNDSIITLEKLYKGAGEPWDPTIKEITGLTGICEYCGEKFPQRNKNHRFCKNPCAASYRRKEKIANSKTVNRNCVICGKSFPIKEIYTTVTCGRECASKHNHRNK